MGSEAFAECWYLQSVTIGNGVTNIEDRAFYNCTSLTSVMIGNSVTNIGSEAFSDCRSLTNITIPSNVTSIGSYAFQYCTGLTSVTVGESVTSIGDEVFSFCPSLTSVYFRGNAPSVGGHLFDGDYNVVVYYLPGTTGWGPTFGHLPSVLWNPQVQTSDGSFGLRTNRFGFNITGTSNLAIVVEACTNLAGSGWVTLQSCTLTNGLLYFSDPQWTDYPARYYRLRWP